MKQTLTILSFLISVLVYSQASEKNFIDQNYIEVTGTAEMEIVPDEIYLKIIINENDLKGKATLENLEKSMIRTLDSLNIDTQKDLAIIDFSSNIKYYYIKENKIYQSKEYELKVKDAATIGKVMQKLTGLGISNIDFSKVDHSRILDFKKQVRIEAMKIAKEKANELVSAIDQSLGRAIYIQELDNLSINNNLGGHLYGVQSNVRIRGSRSDSEELLLPEIEFEKIKLQYSILARFEIR